MDLEDFKFGRTKISSLRILDETSPELAKIMSNWTAYAKHLNMIDVKKPDSILVSVVWSLVELFLIWTCRPSRH